MADPVDELFALPVEEFTARRDALARQLRTAGEKQAAAQVRGLRRPTVSAWALNQLVRRHPDEIDALIAAGQELRTAQQGGHTGDRAAFRAATRQRRDQVKVLRERAAAILTEAGIRSEGHLQDVAVALEAASADPDAAEELRAGRLSRPPTAPTGFELLDLAPDTDVAGGERDTAPPEAAAPRGEPEPHRTEEPDLEDQRAGAATAVEDARQLLAARREALEQAIEAAEAAQEQAEATRARADDLHRRAEEAQAAALTAAQAAEEAEAASASAAEAVVAAKRALAEVHAP